MASGQPSGEPLPKTTYVVSTSFRMTRSADVKVECKTAPAVGRDAVMCVVGAPPSEQPYGMIVSGTMPHELTK